MRCRLPFVPLPFAPRPALVFGLAILAGLASIMGVDVRPAEAFRADNCTEYQYTMHLVGKLPPSCSFDSPGAVIDGHYAYCLCAQGLAVADISDCTNTRQVALIPLTRYGPSQVVVSGKHAFVSDRFNGLYVIDIADPASPRIVANLESSGGAQSVAVAGRFAYLACWNVGLQVVDISNPASPTIVASLPTPGGVRKVAVEGRKAYLCDSVAGLLIVDINNPKKPALAGGTAVGRMPWSVAVKGDYAYVVDYYDGFKVVDVSDDNSPRVIAAVELFGQTADVEIQGDILFVLNEMSLYTFDVSDPQSPRLLGNYVTSGQATDIEVAGSLALLSSYSGGAILLDVATPANGSGVETAELPAILQGAQIANGIAFSATERGFRVLDLSTRGSVREAGYVSFYGAFVPVATALGGSLAFVSYFDGYRGGFVVIDISQPDHPVLTRIHDTGGYIHRLAATGRYLYCVTGYPARIDIYDAANPAQPVLIDSFAPATNAQYVEGIRIFGSKVVIWNADTIWIYDISLPNSPQYLGFVAAPGYVKEVQLAGSRLYFASDKIWVYDISDASGPVLLGQKPLLSGLTTNMAVIDDHVYLGCGSYGVDVYDAADPMHISWAGTIRPLPSSLNAWPVEVRHLQADSGRVLFWGPSRIFWADPQCAVPLSVEIDVRPGAAESTLPCTGARGRLPVAIFSGNDFDATTVDPATAKLESGAVLIAANTLGHGHERDVDGDGDVDFVLDFSLEGARIPCVITEISLTARTFDGTHIRGVDNVRTIPRGADALHGQPTLANVPNPFNPMTTVRFSVATAGLACVAVYDVAGRLVRTLVDQDMPPGSHEVVWDGRDSSGREVSSGTYMARLECDGRVESVRMGLVR